MSDTAATCEQPKIAKCGNCGLEGDYDMVAEHAETCLNQTVIPVTLAACSENEGCNETQETVITVTNIPEDEPLPGEQAEKKVFIWTSAATNQLISMYAERKDAFSDRQVRKKRLWVEMSQELKKRGVDVTAAQVENKWKSLKGCYKRNKASLRRRRSEYTTRQIGSKLAFFKSLEEVLQSEVTSGSDEEGCNTPSSSNSIINMTTTSTPTRPNRSNCVQPTIITLPSGSTVSSGTLSDALHPRIVTLVSNPSMSTTAGRNTRQVTVASDISSTEPTWFRSYREDCERRHQERINLQRDWMKQQKQLMGQVIDAFLQCKKCRHR